MALNRNDQAEQLDEVKSTLVNPAIYYTSPGDVRGGAHNEPSSAINLRVEQTVLIYRATLSADRRRCLLESSRIILGRFALKLQYAKYIMLKYKIYIKQTRVSYTVYNSRMTVSSIIISDFLDSPPPRIAE
ncbi:hypothetical protein J6590_049266 [Homalodisca vitripennis]|nr:hypothetical protein J6590_049266 [Homalodisca vitripennis]